MLELTKDTYDECVCTSEAPVVVDFWGDTCVRCRQIMPGLEEVENDFRNHAIFAKVNIQGNRRLAMREQVMSLPSVLIYSGGEKKAFLTGSGFTAEDVRKKLTEILG